MCRPANALQDFGACRLISMGWIFQGSQGSVWGVGATQEAPGDSQPAAFQAGLWVLGYRAPSARCWSLWTPDSRCPQQCLAVLLGQLCADTLSCLTAAQHHLLFL